MATNTYTALATQTLSSPAASVTFSSIPQGYTDLVVVYNGTMSPADYALIRVGNGSIDTASNYSSTRIVGNGSTATSGRDSNAVYFAAPEPLNTNQNNIIMQFQNYSNTSTFKTCLMRANVPLTDGGATGTVSAVVGLWRSTSAINQIRFSAYSSGNFATGSTFTIYGIAAASVGAKATGGTIYQDASYFYHVFAGNGTFTPSQALSADVLVVAGGGSGGGQNGGGGGAGGLLAFTSQSLTTTGYTCTVGAGGSSGGVGTSNSGSNTTFTGLTAAVGGGGGGYFTGGTLLAGRSGGSGGGGGGANASAVTGGTATSGQGYNGGSGVAGGNYAGGGGGGAGAVGQSVTLTEVGGNGGVGSSAYSSWSLATGIGQNVSGTYYIAGGGGGGGDTTSGTGGLGGGGTAGTASAAQSGAANTGSGGGAARGTAATGAGGSGIVIVRYAK